MTIARPFLPTIMTEQSAPNASLTDDELALEQAIELPERDALTVINLLPLPIPTAAPSPAPTDIVDPNPPTA
jgi:hypothetical protein